LAAVALATKHDDMVGEYLKVLSEVCEGLCGHGFPHELGMAVLFAYGGMRAPSAVAFLGERRMWEYIRNHESVMNEWQSAMNERQRNTNHALVLCMHKFEGVCVCGAKNMPAIAGRYCAAMSYYGRATMTKQLACHWPCRLSNVTERWVTEGPWKVEDPTRKQWTDRCAMADLWMGLWINTSEVALQSGVLQYVYHTNKKIRFRHGLSEREFLYYANREQIREAIANTNGTEVVRIEGDDYTSRAEWVRVFYNSLRLRPLKAWPYVDP